MYIHIFKYKNNLYLNIMYLYIILKFILVLSIIKRVDCTSTYLYIRVFGFEYKN